MISVRAPRLSLRRWCFTLLLAFAVLAAGPRSEAAVAAVSCDRTSVAGPDVHIGAPARSIALPTLFGCRSDSGQFAFESPQVTWESPSAQALGIPAPTATVDASSGVLSLGYPGVVPKTPLNQYWQAGSNVSVVVRDPADPVSASGLSLQFDVHEGRLRCPVEVMHGGGRWIWVNVACELPGAAPEAYGVSSYSLEFAPVTARRGSIAAPRLTKNTSGRVYGYIFHYLPHADRSATRGTLLEQLELQVSASPSVIAGTTVSIPVRAPRDVVSLRPPAASIRPTGGGSGLQLRNVLRRGLLLSLQSQAHQSEFRATATIAAARARQLGIRTPARNGRVTIGTGHTPIANQGDARVRIGLTPAARRAFARAMQRTGRRFSLPTRVQLTYGSRAPAGAPSSPPGSITRSFILRHGAT
jgi:hypothetical protein